MKKYVIYAEFDTKRGKDYFVAEERKRRMVLNIGICEAVYGICRMSRQYQLRDTKA